MYKSLVLSVVFILILASMSFGATLNLKAQWTPNTESDMSHYVLSRTDGTRTIIPTCSHVNQPVLPLPAIVECNFSVTVADGVVMTFVINAVDLAGNSSIDSLPATYTAPNLPPAQPGGPAWKIILQ